MFSVWIVVLIGLILLAGIVVNNAIILVDYTNRLRRQGMAKLEALKKAGSVRLRPILTTTSTPVLALLPMAVARPPTTWVFSRVLLRYAVDERLVPPFDPLFHGRAVCSLDRHLCY